MPQQYIGLMSGTSLDAVDGALVDLGGPLPRTLAFASIPMPAALRSRLEALQQPGPDELERAALAAIDISELYARVVHCLLSQACAPRARVVALGAHGQTVRHRPERGFTTQLLDGALLAERTGIPTVCDFRSTDIAAGGQGAPLVPAFHASVFSHPDYRRAIVNIGGIANVSLLAPDGTITGFDTGPGNTLLDHWCRLHQGVDWDANGNWAAGGTPHTGLLRQMLAEPYFDRPAPKSTGRDLFNAGWLNTMLEAAGLSIAAQDVQATLVELTVSTIARTCRDFGAHEVFVCGGGALNVHMMHRLRAACPEARVDSTEALGVAPQAVESIAFGWLAARRLRGLPGNLPAVTGAIGRRVLGALYLPPATTGLQAPEDA